MLERLCSSVVEIAFLPKSSSLGYLDTCVFFLSLRIILVNLSPALDSLRAHGMVVP
jgi:hypothetical protein